MVSRNLADGVKSRVILGVVDKLAHIIYEDDVGSAVPENRGQLGTDGCVLVSPSGFTSGVVRIKPEEGWTRESCDDVRDSLTTIAL